MSAAFKGQGRPSWPGAHGSHLDGLVDRLGAAVDAAGIASTPGDSHGLLCAFLPPIISPVEQEATTAKADRYHEVGGRTEQLRLTASSPNGDVGATVRADGSPTDLRFGDRADQVPYSR